MNSIKGLATGRGVALDDLDTEDDEVIVSRYFHITACAPGGIADADGGFAERVFKAACKYSGKEPTNYMAVPTDWLKSSWRPGEVSMMGGEDYLLPFSWPPGELKAASAQPSAAAAQPT